MDTKLDARIVDKARAAARTLGRLARVQAVYVFGSHTENRADAFSDIDIAAFVDGVETWDIRERARAMVLVMDEVGAEVETILLPAAYLQSPPRGSFAAHVLAHGVRVHPASTTAYPAS